jgi:hypothetical protein
MTESPEASAAHPHVATGNAHTIHRQVHTHLAEREKEKEKEKEKEGVHP